MHMLIGYLEVMWHLTNNPGTFSDTRLRLCSLFQPKVKDSFKKKQANIKRTFLFIVCKLNSEKQVKPT